LLEQPPMASTRASAAAAAAVTVRGESFIDISFCVGHSCLLHSNRRAANQQPNTELSEPDVRFGRSNPDLT
jgi:hypothetical protein